MIKYLRSIYELNNDNTKFIFFNTASDHLIYDWHYDYIKDRNFIIDYDFQKYLYLNSKYDAHHFNNDYHYNICLPRYVNLLNFDFNINDFYYKHHEGSDISYDYLYPINNDNQYKVLFYDELNNKYEYFGNYDCLLNFDNKFKSKKFKSDYHNMYIAPQTQSIIYNYGKNNGKTLLIIGESQILPEISIFAYYYRKVLYYDNRYPNKIMYDILYNTQIDDCLVEMWSGRKINMYEINNMKVALTAIVKNENRYLKEWVEYYKQLGIDHIYIGDNNDSNGEQLEDVLQDYLNLPDPYITIINIKNKKMYQNVLYKYVYNEYGHKYDWMCFFDIDEFLYLKEDDSIQNYLSRTTFNNVDQIHINWLIYDDNDLIEYDDRPVRERFTRISESQLHFVKSIIRCNINKDLIFATHTIYPKDRSYPNNYLRTCNSTGNRWVDDVQCTYNDNEAELNYTQIALLKHYKTKSFNEFIKRKANMFAADNGNKYNRNDIIGLWSEVNKFTDVHKKIFDEYESSINCNS